MKKQIKYFVVAFLTMFIATIGVSAACDSDQPAGQEAALIVGGSTKYCTLKDAIGAAQKGATVQLLKEYKYSQTDASDRIVIDDGKEITFDFNGSKIIAPNYKSEYAAVKVDGSGTKVTFTDSENNDGGIVNEKGGSTLLVSGGAEVTITGGTYTSSGKSDDNKNYGAIASDGSTLIVNGANVLINGSVDVFGNSPKLTFTDGTIDSTGFAISGNGSKTKDSTILIEGGKLTSTGNTAIYHPQSGTLTITGGEITGKVGIVARQGTINVQGGTITGNGESNGNYTTGDNSNKLASGSAIIVDNKATGYGNNTTVKITGGVIKASEAVSNAVSSYEEETIADYDITGGEFNKPFNTSFVKESKAEVKLSNGNYYVGASAEKAVQDATSGTTVEVLQGTLTVTNVNGGVTVKNSGNGKVTVNGTELQNNQEITIPTSSSSSSSSKKDYTIVENVVYADNGENIEIEGKIVKDTDETYKAMLKMAEDKGYKTLYNMYDFWVKDNKSLTKPVTITFNLGESYNGKMAYIIHKLHDGSYQELEAEVVDGKVSITVKELSPFTLSLKDNTVVDNPQTSSMNIIASGILTTMSLVGIIVLVKKRNA